MSINEYVFSLTSLIFICLCFFNIKFDCVKAIKQKLHMKSRAGEETQRTDAQQEEDKMKMLLGPKLLVSIIGYIVKYM